MSTKNPRNPPSTFVRIGQFVLDVSIEESHTFEADVTDYPVESGGSISDNIRPKPIKVTIHGVVSDSPLKSNADNKPMTLPDPYGGKELDVIAFAANFTDTADLGTPGPIPTAPVIKFLRSEQAFTYLLQVWKSADVVTIRTSLGTFDNMAMTSFDVPRNKETGGGLTFTATFQQIQKVTNNRVRSRVAVRNGKKKTNRGVRAGQEWVAVPVTWNKGRPPGSADIYDIETVIWTSDPVAAAGGGSAPVVGVGAALANAATAAAARDTHRWCHEEDGSALTEFELRVFKIDLARDRGIAASRKALGLTGPAPIHFLPIDDAAPVTKTATQQYNEAFKHGVTDGFLSKPKDPNFTNKDSFNQGMGNVGDGRGLGNVGKGPGLGKVGNGKKGMGNF